MYCDIKLHNMEKFSLIFHFSHSSDLYSGKQDKDDADRWKIFSILGRAHKRAEFSLIITYYIGYKEVLFILSFFIQVIEMGGCVIVHIL